MQQYADICLPQGNMNLKFKRNCIGDFSVNKYLHTVAPCWIFMNIELRCMEP